VESHNTEVLSRDEHFFYGHIDRFWKAPAKCYHWQFFNIYLSSLSMILAQILNRWLEQRRIIMYVHWKKEQCEKKDAPKIYTKWSHKCHSEVLSKCSYLREEQLWTGSHLSEGKERALMLLATQVDTITQFCRTPGSLPPEFSQDTVLLCCQPIDNHTRLAWTRYCKKLNSFV
jgi:hypothetical protein